jgi:ribosomal protein L24
MSSTHKIKVGDTVLVKSGNVNDYGVVKRISKRTQGLTVKMHDGNEFHVMPYEVKRQNSVELLGV